MKYYWRMQYGEWDRRRGVDSDVWQAVRRCRPQSMSAACQLRSPVAVGPPPNAVWLPLSSAPFLALLTRSGVVYLVITPHSQQLLLLLISHPFNCRILAILINPPLASSLTSFLFLPVTASLNVWGLLQVSVGITWYIIISKKKNTVDKSKIKDKRKVKPKDKSWVKIGWRTKNRKGWCFQKR